MFAFASVNIGVRDPKLKVPIVAMGFAQVAES